MAHPSLEALSLEQDAKISLFTLDLVPIGINIKYRFCAEVQSNGLNVRFQGNEFTSYPIEATGFEKSNRGQSAQPTLSASNIGGLLSALLSQSDDLVGAIVTRQKTYAKYLDGQSEANPQMEMIPEVYRVARKTYEAEDKITLELQDIMSFGNLKLPRRRMQKFTCVWQYRSAECGYTGTAYFDKNDKATGDPNVDVCGKRLSSCECRFGKNAELPFGGFPGIDA